jgi:hypothetical protein
LPQFKSFDSSRAQPLLRSVPPLGRLAKNIADTPPYLPISSTTQPAYDLPPTAQNLVNNLHILYRALGEFKPVLLVHQKI